MAFSFMSFELFLALRYLYSRRRRPLARVTGAAALLSLALGVAALLAALALARGWQEEISDKLLRDLAHIVITRRDGVFLPDWRVYAARISQTPSVTQVRATTYEGALLVGPAGATYAVLRGRDESGVSAGAELATRTGLQIGDTVEVITGAAALAGNPQHERARVTGLFRSGWHDYDATWIYVPLAQAARWAGAPAGAASAFDVQVSDPAQAPLAAEHLRGVLGADFTVLDWQEAQRPLFSALALEQRAAFFVIGLLSFLAALNVLATLVLVVAERRTDIAVLRALGAGAWRIMLIFLLEGAFLGLLGTVCGVALGLALCWLGNRYRWVSLPAGVYLLDFVPFRVRGADVAWTITLAWALSLLATLYPAWAASRVLPGEILKDG